MTNAVHTRMLSPNGMIHPLRAGGATVVVEFVVVEPDLRRAVREVGHDRRPRSDDGGGTMTEPVVADLLTELPHVTHQSGTDAYAAATAPDNSSFP